MFSMARYFCMRGVANDERMKGAWLVAVVYVQSTAVGAWRGMNGAWRGMNGACLPDWNAASPIVRDPSCRSRQWRVSRVYADSRTSPPRPYTTTSQRFPWRSNPGVAETSSLIVGPEVAEGSVLRDDV